MALSDDLVMSIQSTQTRMLETQADQGRAITEHGNGIVRLSESLKTIDSRVLELHQVVVSGGDGRRSFASRLDELELKDRAYHGSLKPAPKSDNKKIATWKSALAIVTGLISAFGAGLAAATQF